MISRRFLIAGAAMLAIGAMPAAAQDAADWPNKDVRVVVGSSPGGTADLVSRLMAERLTAKFGKSFFVENMPGGGGALSTTHVMGQPADGYTVQFGFIGSHSILQSLNPAVGYDVLRDLAPVSLISFAPNVLLVNPQMGPKTLAELIDLLKANPGKYNFGSGGIGNSNHLATEVLLLETDTEAVHIPYGGSGALLAALLANQVPFAFDTLTTGVQHIQSGALLGLAVSSKERNSAAPDIPAVAETVPDFEVIAWNGFFMHANTPKPIVDKLSAAIQEIMKEPEIVERFEKMGTTPVGSTAEEFRDLVAADIAKFAEVIQKAGIKPQ